ncbi:AraC family transcriptional regulator [Anaerolentibacter hominis]|uniref:AraC family transcriptional regulator n=1 Tax=Anaerolentibacter hominis TaxID=3079009 RepID=UPI0031B899AC
MEGIERMNRAVAFIEEHLTEKIDYEQLSEIAGCPVYYFQKIFYYLAGLPLTEYIRRRRMSMAAVDLKNPDSKVLDIALKYGYESPTAFNRAFQGIHGIAPSEVKKPDARLTAYPAVSFASCARGTRELKFTIETKEPFRLLGVSCPLHRDLEVNFSRIPGEWDQAAADGTLSRLRMLNDQHPNGLLGVCIHHADDWRYMIAVSSGQAGNNWEECRIPSAVWAVFSGTGTNRTLQELEQRVITEWLPSSGYQYADIPDIEVYLQADPSETVYEYWLPVQKK